MIVDRSVFEAELDALRVREKAHTREGDAIAAARRRLPMVEVDGATPLIGEHGPVTLLDVFEGRRLLIAYYFMWHAGQPGAGAVRGVHVGYVAGPRAVLYSFPRRHLRRVLPRPLRRERPVPRLHGLGDALVLGAGSLDALLVGRRVGMMHLVCYLRQGSSVFETYWTTRRGVEAMDNSYRLLDLTVYGRQETWEDSPPGWPQRFEGKQDFRTDGRPTAQWSRLKAGHSDDLGTGGR